MRTSVSLCLSKAWPFLAGGPLRHGMRSIFAAGLAAACSREARKDVTPPLAAGAPQAAAGAAAELDPEGGPPPSMQGGIDHAHSRASFWGPEGVRERGASLGVVA